MVPTKTSQEIITITQVSYTYSLSIFLFLVSSYSSSSLSTIISSIPTSQEEQPAVSSLTSEHLFLILLTAHCIRQMFITVLIPSFSPSSSVRASSEPQSSFKASNTQRRSERLYCFEIKIRSTGVAMLESFSRASCLTDAKSHLVARKRTEAHSSVVELACLAKSLHKRQ